MCFSLFDRYFGGIKLGKGGLSRAYGGCARSHLKEAIATGLQIDDIHTQMIQCEVPLSSLGTFYHCISLFDVKQIEATSTVDQSVLKLLVPLDAYQQLKQMALQKRLNVVFTVL